MNACWFGGVYTNVGETAKHETGLRCHGVHGVSTSTSTAPSDEVVR